MKLEVETSMMDATQVMIWMVNETDNHQGEYILSLSLANFVQTIKPVKVNALIKTIANTKVKKKNTFHNNDIAQGQAPLQLFSRKNNLN